MDLDEILKVLGRLYLSLYLEKEILARQVANLRAQVEDLKSKLYPPVPGDTFPSGSFTERKEAMKGEPDDQQDERQTD